ncbi:MAG: ribbon-helix-helix protein, CopG family [Gammaproteobacteria bacterium]|nr:ribbon-helix-helix protein, CopG family [Gammaproteobacteria bacterium]
MATTTLGIKLDEETRERLKALAEDKDCATHWLIKAAIVEYLDKEERAQRERREDMERWGRYMLTGESISHSAALKWFDALAKGCASHAHGSAS